MAKCFETAIFFLMLSVITDPHGKESWNVPELDELVMSTAGKKAFVPWASNFLDGFTDVLPYTANNSIGQDVDSSAEEVK